MAKISVFVDSNVWFSAFYKEGICSRLIRNLVKSPYKIVVSELVLEEIIRNIKQKIPDALSMVIEYLDKIKLTVVKNPKPTRVEQCQDFANTKDLPILISAIDYKCHFFIPGNLKDFRVEKIKDKTGLKILKPSGFIKLIKSS